MEIFKTAFLMVALMLVFIAVGGYVGFLVGRQLWQLYWGQS